MGSDPLPAGRLPELSPPGENAGVLPGTSVLIVDDEPGMRSFLQRGLSRHFALVEVAADTEAAHDLLRRCHFDLLVSDIRLPGKNGVAWVEELRDQGSSLDVIFITAHADLETAIAALRAGASDFILKPFRIDQLLSAMERCTERRRLSRENFLLHRETDRHHTLDGLVGDCEPMKEVCAIINRVAPMRSTVLVQGESGTGKELAARAIHDRSGRPGSFVAINCGAVSPELLESELFGHVKGSFTGAHQARAGAVQLRPRRQPVPRRDRRDAAGDAGQAAAGARGEDHPTCRGQPGDAGGRAHHRRHQSRSLRRGRCRALSR